MSPACGAPSSQAAIEASYLYKLAPFIAWPPSSNRTATICIVGADPFGLLIDQAVAGQSLADRPFQVERVDTVGPSSTCDIAFLGGSDRQSVANALRAVRGAPILTVTDDSETPGMIDFVVTGGRVRFRIDEDAARDSGLSVSSKLLGLALSVKSSRGQPTQ